MLLMVRSQHPKGRGCFFSHPKLYITTYHCLNSSKVLGAGANLVILKQNPPKSSQNPPKNLWNSAQEIARNNRERPYDRRWVCITETWLNLEKLKETEETLRYDPPKIIPKIHPKNPPQKLKNGPKSQTDRIPSVSCDCSLARAVRFRLRVFVRGFCSKWVQPLGQISWRSNHPPSHPPYPPSIACSAMSFADPSWPSVAPASFGSVSCRMMSSWKMVEYQKIHMKMGSKNDPKFRIRRWCSFEKKNVIFRFQPLIFQGVPSCKLTWLMT